MIQLMWDNQDPTSLANKESAQLGREVENTEHRIISLEVEWLNAKHRVNILSLWTLDTDSMYGNIKPLRSRDDPPSG